MYWWWANSPGYFPLLLLQAPSVYGSINQWYHFITTVNRQKFNKSSIRNHTSGLLGEWAINSLQNICIPTASSCGLIYFALASFSLRKVSRLTPIAVFSAVGWIAENQFLIPSKHLGSIFQTWEIQHQFVCKCKIPHSHYVLSDLWNSMPLDTVWVSFDFIQEENKLSGISENRRDKRKHWAIKATEASYPN